MKRLLVLILALGIAGVSVFAGGKKEASADGTYKISFGWFNERNFSDDPVYDIIADKFNVDIAVVPLSWQDRVQQVNLMVASGDMPDVLFYDGTKAQFNEWARTGVIRSIPQFPNAEYPNLSRLWEQMPTAPEFFIVDGELYGWPKYNQSNPVGNWWATGMLYRADWARELGMYQEQYTIDEMLELAIAFVEKDPGNIGRGSVIGYGDNSQWSYIIHAYNNYARFFYQDDSGQWRHGTRDPRTLEGLLALKDFYDAGGYWPDFYAGTQGDVEDLFEAGLMGIAQSNYNLKNLVEAYTGFNNAHPDLEFLDAVEYMDVTNVDGQRWNWQNRSYWSGSIFSPSLSDAKLARILEVMDWMATDDGVNTLFFGVPEEDWTYEGDTPVALWETDADGKPVNPGHQSQILITMTQLAETYSWLDPSVPAEVRAMNIEHLERFSENATIRPIDPFLDTFQGEAYLRHAGALSQGEFFDMVKRLIPTTTRATIAAEYEAWLREIAPRVDAVLAELNAATQ